MVSLVITDVTQGHKVTYLPFVLYIQSANSDVKPAAFFYPARHRRNDYGNCNEALKPPVPDSVISYQTPRKTYVRECLPNLVRKYT